MAKEFKEFDKRFAKLAGTALKTIESIAGSIAQEDIRECDHWPWMDQFTENYTRGAIAYAVYTAPDSLEWQKFRVSLKGLSTYEKMYALMWYWDVHISQGPGSHVSVEVYRRFIIRVNNYLGALKRSGHLNQELRVVKA